MKSFYDGHTSKTPSIPSSFRLSSNNNDDNEEEQQQLGTPPATTTTTRRAFRPMISLLRSTIGNTSSSTIHNKSGNENFGNLHHHQQSSPTDHDRLKHNKMDTTSPTTNLRRQHFESSPKRNRSIAASPIHKTGQVMASPISVHSNSPFTPLPSPPRSITGDASSTSNLSDAACCSTFTWKPTIPNNQMVASSDHGRNICTPLSSLSSTSYLQPSETNNLISPPQQQQQHLVIHHGDNHASSSNHGHTIVAFLFMYSSKNSLQTFERAFPLWQGRTLISRKSPEYFEKLIPRRNDRLPLYDHCICINNLSISKIHALIEISDGDFSFLEDLNSRNRTFIVEKSEKKKRHINIQSRKLYQLRDDNFVLLGNIICKFKLCTEMDETLMQLAVASYKKHRNEFIRKSPSHHFQQTPQSSPNVKSKLLMGPPSTTFTSPSKKSLFAKQLSGSTTNSTATSTPRSETRKTSEILVLATPEMKCASSSNKHNMQDTTCSDDISNLNNISENNSAKNVSRNVRHFIPPTDFILKNKSKSTTTDEKEPTTCQKVLVFETPAKLLENSTKSTTATIFQTPTSSTSNDTPQRQHLLTTVAIQNSSSLCKLSNDHKCNHGNTHEEDDLDLELDDIDLSFLSNQEPQEPTHQKQLENPEPSTSTFNISNCSQFDDIDDFEEDDQEEESQAFPLPNNHKLIHDNTHNNANKRTNEEEPTWQNDQYDEEPSNARSNSNKKQKKYKKSDHQHPHILFTGIQPTEANLRAIERLGGVLVEDAYTELVESRLTHLITDKLRRYVSIMFVLYTMNFVIRNAFENSF